MKILKKVFSKKDPASTAIKAAGSIIDRFVIATSAGIDREDLARYPARQFKVMAFHYGAIEYLSQQLGLDETQQLGVFVVFMNSYFSMPITETGSISERLQGFHEKPDEHRFYQAGLDVFRRWYGQDDQQAPLELAELLKKY